MPSRITEFLRDGDTVKVMSNDPKGMEIAVKRLKSQTKNKLAIAKRRTEQGPMTKGQKRREMIRDAKRLELKAERMASKGNKRKGLR